MQSVKKAWFFAGKQKCSQINHLKPTGHVMHQQV